MKRVQNLCYEELWHPSEVSSGRSCHVWFSIDSTCPQGTVSVFQLRKLHFQPKIDLGEWSLQGELFRRLGNAVWWVISHIVVACLHMNSLSCVPCNLQYVFLSEQLLDQKWWNNILGQHFILLNSSGLLGAGFQRLGSQDKLRDNPLQHLFEVSFWPPHCHITSSFQSIP